jgi:hypothetical protein
LIFGNKKRTAGNKSHDHQISCCKLSIRAAHHLLHAFLEEDYGLHIIHFSSKCHCLCTFLGCHLQLSILETLNFQLLHIKFSWRSLIADNRKILVLREQKQNIGGHRKRQIASRQHHEVEILMVFASFRSDFTLYKAKFLENAVVTSENSWCDVTQSEGGAATGPN